MDTKSEILKRNIYTEAEKQILRELVSIHKEVLENKKIDKVALQRKDAVWRQVSKQFNSQNGVTLRSAESLKKCWDNMKTAAKREFKNQKVELFRTGGGKCGVEPSTSSIEVHAIVASQIEPLVNEYDDDFMGQNQDIDHCLPNVPYDSTEGNTSQQVLALTNHDNSEQLLATFDLPTVISNSTQKKKSSFNPGHEETLMEYEKKEHEAKMGLIRQKSALNVLKRRVYEEKLATSKAECSYWEEKKLKLQGDN